MNETSRFIIRHHKTNRPHYDLTLENNKEIRSWILPGGVPGVEKERKIAIEEAGEDMSIDESLDDIYKDAYGQGRLKTWDSGPYSILTENSIKYIISASGEKFKGRYLLHNPGWGRWTKKKLWVIEKVPAK